jgi:hypothetical protein
LELLLISNLNLLKVIGMGQDVILILVPRRQGKKEDLVIFWSIVWRNWLANIRSI